MKNTFTCEQVLQHIREIQLIELDILHSFIDACDKMNLKYYALCGTTLGAVRHHGFIPWDDDVDVGLLRKDYDYFIEHAREYLPTDIEIYSREHNPSLTIGFCKLKRKNDLGLELFVDVFPLDYYPEKNDDAFFRKKTHLNWRIMLANSIEAPTWKQKVMVVLLMMRWPSVKSALREREKHFRSIPNSSLIANLCGPYKKREICPLEWLGEGIMLDFEGISLRCPVKTDEYLTHLYGDYMKLPPEDQRIPKHFKEL